MDILLLERPIIPHFPPQPIERVDSTPLGNFYFVSTLGNGEHGAVSKYQCPETGLSFAIKQEKVGENVDGIRDVFIQEIQSLSLLKGCDHVCQIKGFAFKRKKMTTHTWISLEHYSCNLEQYMFASPLTQRLGVFKTLVSHMRQAFHHVHSAGIIHQDVKPSNILVRTELDTSLHPDSVSFHLADFGVSYMIDEEMGWINGVSEVYAIDYRPPEVHLSEQFNNRADIWALGMSLLEFITRDISKKPEPVEAILPLRHRYKGRLKLCHLPASVDVPKYISNYLCVIPSLSPLSSPITSSSIPTFPSALPITPSPITSSSIPTFPPSPITSLSIPTFPSALPITPPSASIMEYITNDQLEMVSSVISPCLITNPAKRTYVCNPRKVKRKAVVIDTKLRESAKRLANEMNLMDRTVDLSFNLYERVINLSSSTPSAAFTPSTILFTCLFMIIKLIDREVTLNSMRICWGYKMAKQEVLKTEVEIINIVKGVLIE
jgi:serine/threonine protein kinase